MLCYVNLSVAEILRIDIMDITFSFMFLVAVLQRRTSLW